MNMLEQSNMYNRTSIVQNRIEETSKYRGSYNKGSDQLDNSQLQSTVYFLLVLMMYALHSYIRNQL